MPFSFPTSRLLGLTGLVMGLGLGHGQTAPAQAPVSAPVSAQLPDTAVSPLEGLIQEALKNNRSLKAMEYRVEALHSSPDHTWYLEPPEIGVEFFQAPISSFPNPIKDQMEVDYSLQQSFPFPGKISARVEVEHKHAQSGEADLEAGKRRLIREVKTRYYELYLLDRRLEFTREDQALVNRFIDIARKQYEVGMGRQTDILRAQTELTRLKTDSITLEQSRRGMEAMLNAILGRGRKTARRIAVADSLAPLQIEWDLDTVLPILKERHPELQARRSLVAMREAENAMARKEYYPDFMVRGAYKQMLEDPVNIHGIASETGDFWSFMIGMNLPFAFWSAPKYKAGVTRSQAAWNQAREEYSDLENQAYARAQEALLKAGSNAELARISRSTLLPQAQQALESNLAAYQGGRGEFMTLLDAYRMRLMARQNAEMALMQLLVSQAELEEAIGMDLVAVGNRISGGNGK